MNRKRGGSSFPKQRDPAYRWWIRTENPCLMLGRELRRLISLNDIGRGPYGGDGVIHFEHRCYGEIEPAHVGEHQAQGAPDFGVIVPLCHAAHRYYDEHRSDWKHVTRFTEKGMALAASGYALKYVEQGGAAVRAAGGTPE